MASPSSVASSTLYFFRHVHFNQCIVSPSFVLRAMHMAQTGNPHTPVRHDKWVPFLVATNIPAPQTKKQLRDFEIFKRVLIRDNFSLKHGVKIRTPEFRRPEDDEVLQSKSRLMARRFCELLNERADIFQRSVPEAEPLASAAVEGAGGESGAAEQPAALGTAETDAGATISGPMTLLWERMGDREAVLEEAGLHWPDWVEHDQLHLANGRFPLNIPGLMNLPKKMELKRAAEPKRMARQKAIWEVADALSGKKAYKRPY